MPAKIHSALTEVYTMEHTFAVNLLSVILGITGIAYAIITLPFRILWAFITGESPYQS
jgi:lantibiotic modifying enzyme